jgi:hypothetical protein
LRHETQYRKLPLDETLDPVSHDRHGEGIVNKLSPITWIAVNFTRAGLVAEQEARTTGRWSPRRFRRALLGDREELLIVSAAAALLVFGLIVAVA